MFDLTGAARVFRVLGILGGLRVKGSEASGIGFRG